MNYIKHLTGFFNKSNQDQTIMPTHISLYLALFQRWNLNRFKNPILISREEMMLTSKIKSKATYHKCMKELHQKKYIIYKPSFNPYEGTEVILPDLSIMTQEIEEITSSNFDNTIPLIEPNLTKKEVTSSNFNHTVPLIEPNLTNEDVKSDLTVPNFERTELKNSQVNEQLYIYNNKTFINNSKHIIESKKNQKNTPTGKNDFIIPTIELIKAYFLEKNTRELEAEKFLNYYSSNGWLVGGKTPMKDWQAAARNWILNLSKFNTNKSPNQLSPKNLNVSNNKDYAEPL